MADFLKEFFQGTPESRKVAMRKGDKYTVRTDKWDRMDHQDMADQVTELKVAEDDIEAFVKTGRPAMVDLFHSLLQAMPHLKDPKELDPQYRVNGAVAREMQEVREYADLRAYTISDPISAALSGASLEPTLEVVFDKQKELQKLADELKDQLQEYVNGESSLNQMLEQLASDDMTEEEREELQQQIDDLMEQLEALKQQAMEGSQELDDKLDDQGYEIRAAMAKGMEEAADTAEGTANLGLIWGSEPGEMKKMDPQKRLELSKRIDNPRFRQLAALIGPMVHFALGAQRDKVHYVPEEVYDIELGNDLQRLIPSEWITMGHPILKIDFLRRFTEHGLTQYVLRGREREAKGGIIACSDSSGSMHGSKEIWAMATSLALLRIAKQQKRPFTGLLFGSPGEYIKWVFDTSGKSFTATRTSGRGEDPITLEGIDAILDYAGFFMASGTDFETPFNVAIEQLQNEHDTQGAVDGDIVFITDGECRVSDEWKKQYFETQGELGFKTYGIAIGCSTTSEPLASLCNNKVIGVTELDAGDAKSIFGMV